MKNMKTIESVLLDVQNRGHPLLVWDDDLDDEIQSLAGIYYMPPKRITNQLLTVDSIKPCPEHDDVLRHYVQHVRGCDAADLIASPDLMQWTPEHIMIADECEHPEDYEGERPEFEVWFDMCAWWSLADMLANRDMMRVNGDVVGTLELLDAEIL